VSCRGERDPDPNLPTVVNQSFGQSLQLTSAGRWCSSAQSSIGAIRDLQLNSVFDPEHNDAFQLDPDRLAWVYETPFAVTIGNLIQVDPISTQ
jgi:hypothetical protein